MTDPTYPERIFATATRAKGSTGQIGTWREADDGTGRVEYVRADLVQKLERKMPEVSPRALSGGM